MYRKLIFTISTVLLLTIAAGMYGIIHDFITYKISHEYYTKFKFVQFGFIAPDNKLPINTLQLLVATGWAATWWVGCLAGLVFSLVAVYNTKIKNSIAFTLRATVILFLTAIVSGLLGYNIGHFATPLSLPDLAEFCYECATIKKPANFTTAGYIHNFSYIGGLLGIVLGVASILKQRHNVAVKTELDKNRKA